VQHPFPLPQEILEGPGQSERGGVDQRRPGRLGTDLHQVGLRAVPVGGGPLGVHGHTLLGLLLGALAPVQEGLHAVGDGDQAVTRGI
jgi:hypothetical protein